MKLSFQIATRFLKSSLSQTLIIILGIGIGVSVQIFIGSLIQGLQQSLVDTTIGNSSHITIKTDTDDPYIADYTLIQSKALETDERIIYSTPSLNASALLETDNDSQSLLIRGFNLSQAEEIYNFADYLIEGQMPLNSGQVILGISVRDKYDLVIGDTIELVTPDRETVIAEISGFYDYKVNQINDNWAITSLTTAQNLFALDDVATSIEFQVGQSDIFVTDAIASDLKSLLSNTYDINISEWQSENEQLLSGLQGQSISSLMIQIFVMISVVLGIASVLAITVMQKSRQIGILKAMGIQDISSSLIFLFEGLILGIFGAIAGILIGIGLAYAFTTFAVNADGTPVVALYIDPAFIALSGAIAIIACIFASLIPARKSLTLNPIDIIRN